MLNLVLGVLHLALGARADRDDAAGARRHGDAESVPQEGATAVAEGAVEAPGRPEPEDAEPPAAVDPAAVAPDLPATDDQDRALAPEGDAVGDVQAGNPGDAPPAETAIEAAVPLEPQHHAVAVFAARSPTTTIFPSVWIASARGVAS